MRNLGIHGRPPGPPAAARRPVGARVPRLRLGGHRRLPRRRDRRDGPLGRQPRRAARRSPSAFRPAPSRSPSRRADSRPRPHALGDARRRHGGQRAPAHRQRGPRAHRAQRHRRELAQPAPGARGRRRRVHERHRRRGRRAPDRVVLRRRPRGRGRPRAAQAARALGGRRRRRRPARHDRRRPQGGAARHRPRRRRELHRFRRRRRSRPRRAACSRSPTASSSP